MSAFSKTDEFCDCGTLQQAADNLDLPIVFDAKTNEFQIVFDVNGRKGHFNLWHCPLCGGKAPESKRHLLFATISNDERSRLREIINPLKTLDEVLTALGEPDEDYADGVMIALPETENSPPEEQAYRSLVYENISDVADIRVTVYPNKLVGIGFTGKYIGDKNEA